MLGIIFFKVKKKSALTYTDVDGDYGKGDSRKGDSAEGKSN